MALETLKSVEEINGVKIKRVAWNRNPHDYIEINDSGNAITFNIQDGPIKEKGVNGCQVEDIMATCHKIIERLNEKFPCDENREILSNLSSAIYWSKERTKNRIARNVEGKSEA